MAFIESVSGRFEPSMNGNALAMAKAAPPLQRATASRLVADVVEYARAVNSDDSWAYQRWLWYLVAMFAMSTGRAMLMSHVNYSHAGDLKAALA
jgi:hypothetical protein